MKHCIVGLMVVSMLCMTARADWEYDPDNPDWKMHWPQLPDLTPNGMDVFSTIAHPEEQIIVDPTIITIPAITGKLLADDWHCTETGFVEDIHIWGSWLEDLESPSGIMFNLAIYKNVAVGEDPNPDIQYSHPGEEIWRVNGIFPVARPQFTVPQEQFYDPNQHEIIGQDWTVWQYNFFFDAAGTEPPFWQEQSNIYWLSVEPIYQTWEWVDPTPDDPFNGDEYIEPLFYRWGWKTTNPFETPHFEDDAVYWDIAIDPAGGVTVGPYNELRYPPAPEIDSLLWDESIDLAFVITPEPATMGLLGLGLAGMVLRRRKNK